MAYIHGVYIRHMQTMYIYGTYTPCIYMAYIHGVYSALADLVHNSMQGWPLKPSQDHAVLLVTNANSVRCSDAIVYL
jgi:hypothetical protein